MYNWIYQTLTCFTFFEMTPFLVYIEEPNDGEYEAVWLHL